MLANEMPEPGSKYFPTSKVTPEEHLLHPDTRIGLDPKTGKSVVYSGEFGGRHVVDPVPVSGSFVARNFRDRRKKGK
jgi:hypothetical protein